MINKKLSNYLSKKLGLDIEYFYKNVPHMLFSNVTLSFLGLLISIILARNLSVETFGYFNLLMSTIGLVSIFSLPGLNNSMFRGLVNNYDGNFRKAFLLKRKYSIFSLLIFIPMMIYYFSNKPMFFSLLFISIIFPFYLSRQIWTQFLHSKSQFITANNLQIVQTAILVLVMFATSLFTNNLILIIISYIGVFLITDYLFFKYAHKRVKNKALSKELFSYGKFLTKLNVINVLAQHLDSFFIGVFVGPAELTIYAVAKLFYTKSKDFVKSAIVTAGPKFVEHNTLKPRFYLIAGLGGLLFSLLLIAIIKPLVVIFFGDRFLDSINLARILLIAIPFFTIATLLRSHLLYHTMSKNIQSLDAIIPSGMKILLIIPLYYYFGILGVATTIILQQIMSILVMAYGLIKYKHS